MSSRYLLVLILTLIVSAVDVDSVVAQARSAEVFASADIDDGNLRVVTTTGRQIVIAKTDDVRAVEVQQAFFEKPVLSANRMAVGSRAYYANCCTSYEIPLAL